MVLCKIQRTIRNSVPRNNARCIACEHIFFFLHIAIISGQVLFMWPQFISALETKIMEEGTLQQMEREIQHLHKKDLDRSTNTNTQLQQVMRDMKKIKDWMHMLRSSLPDMRSEASKEKKKKKNASRNAKQRSRAPLPTMIPDYPP